MRMSGVLPSQTGYLLSLFSARRVPETPQTAANLLERVLGTGEQRQFFGVCSSEFVKLLESGLARFEVVNRRY
jgi:hypothetical protein